MLEIKAILYNWTTTDRMEFRFSLNNKCLNELRIHLADTIITIMFSIKNYIRLVIIQHFAKSNKLLKSTIIISLAMHACVSLAEL